MSPRPRKPLPASAPPSSTCVAGVDGCPGGWFVVQWIVGTSTAEALLVPDIAGVLAATSACTATLIDIPIGLLDAAMPGGRPCDRAARAFLGGSSSVFSPPVRPALAATSYAEALRLNRASSPHALGISIQCYNILDRVAAADAVMTPELQMRLGEGHPEVSFRLMTRLMAGGEASAMVPAREALPRKYSREGQARRIALLEAVGFAEVAQWAARNRPVGKATLEDILDALALAWSAARWASGQALVLRDLPPPSNSSTPSAASSPILDSRGLRMEITA